MRTTPEDIKRMAAVMLAAAEGKKIQCRREGWVGEWTAVREPSWDWTAYDYRVKPAAVKYRVGLFHYNNGCYGSKRFFPHAVLYEEQQGDDREKWGSFVRWLTDWHEVEV